MAAAGHVRILRGASGGDALLGDLPALEGSTAELASRCQKLRHPIGSQLRQRQILVLQPVPR
ncbi:MAG: hypothetical protein ACRDQ7_12955 [Haloechinothrix sp.]